MLRQDCHTPRRVDQKNPAIAAILDSESPLCEPNGRNH